MKGRGRAIVAGASAGQHQRAVGGKAQLGEAAGRSTARSISAIRLPISYRSA